MGNLDKIVIFNRSYGIIVRGSDYNNDTDVVDIALKKFIARTNASIRAWYEAKDSNPELVNPDYRPEDERDITSIEVYEIHD